jgi:hypothetical protein
VLECLFFVSLLLCVVAVLIYLVYLFPVVLTFLLVSVVLFVGLLGGFALGGH